MANEIKKALEEAVEKDNESPELSARVKKLLARKKNLRRKSHNPRRVRRDK
jgi:hypothetical protein